MKEHLLPTRIVDGAKLENESTLFRSKGLYARINYQVSEWNQYLKMTGGGSFIVLDFGKEMQGGVRLITNWVEKVTCKVRIRFGESLGEVNSELGEKNSQNAHNLRDFETTICAYSDATFGQTGFRFVRIDLLEENNYIYFKNIYCVNHIYKKNPVYTYQGADSRIAAIFEAAKRTVDLCASEGYVWDGIKRDRVVWVGDLAPEVMALSAIYGRTAVIERTLNLSKKIAPLPRFMNDIYTYSMWWVIMLADYYKEFACAEFIQKQLSYLVGLIDTMDGLVNEEGVLNTEIRYIVDWPTRFSSDELVGVRAIFLMAMNAAEYLLKAFNLSVDKVLDIKRRLLLVPLCVESKKQVIALKYFAVGEITDEEYDKLVEGGAKGFSTFMSYYILSTIASRDEALAIELMKEYYGAMLDRGATTFWEDFNMEWLEGSGRIDEFDPSKKDIHGDGGAHCYVGFRHSLCHGWSAGVAKFIKEHCHK
ncbi:MAG: alpha-L-rhamnosidase [Clostridia bacterium]|nr:alpha-L-rhamnosidase [Clostridia bacterium]